MAVSPQITEKDTATSRGARHLIEQAVKVGATAIHIEPAERMVVVRFRRASSLYVAAKLPKSAGALLTAYFKQRAGLDKTKKQALQSGNYVEAVGDQSIDCELNFVPVVDGEKITLHLRPHSPPSLSLETLGLTGDNLANVGQAIAQPSGLILVAGQQANVTLQTVTALVQSFAKSAYKLALISSEKLPLLDKAIKSCIRRPDIGFDAAHYLKSLSKANYDVIGIDMLISRSSARASEAAANDGALVIAGVPALTAAEGLVFMKRLTGNPALFHQVRAVIAVRQVAGLCAECRESYELGYADKLRLTEKIPGLKISTKLWRPNLLGCKTCSHTGYEVAVGLFEVLVPGQEKPATSLLTDAVVKAVAGRIGVQTLFDLVNSY